MLLYRFFLFHSPFGTWMQRKTHAFTFQVNSCFPTCLVFAPSTNTWLLPPTASGIEVKCSTISTICLNGSRSTSETRFQVRFNPFGYNFVKFARISFHQKLNSATKVVFLWRQVTWWRVRLRVPRHQWVRQLLQARQGINVTHLELQRYLSFNMYCRHQFKITICFFVSCLFCTKVVITDMHWIWYIGLYRYKKINKQRNSWFLVHRLAFLTLLLFARTIFSLH